MLWVVIGVTYGAVIGWISNMVLFRRIKENHRAGREPLKGVGGIFLLRYLLDAVALLLFAFIVRDTWAIISSAVSLTIAVKISLFIAFARKGGRFD